MGSWLFQEQSPAAVRSDPIEAELFKTAHAEEGEYSGTDALVREVLQNSIDASDRTGPVCVRFALHSESDAPDRDRLAHYFARLKPALDARGIKFSASGVPTVPCRFLLCEDFGTRGLGGDPLLASDPNPRNKSCQDFFWFWKNINRSGKTGEQLGQLGRWGLGKTVFRAASRVGCMLGLTVRAVDRRSLLMGQAALRIHKYEGKEYVPYGFWCDGANADRVLKPIDDPTELARFRSEWRLMRTKQPGLSVVVPYVPEELRAIHLLQAVVVNFFTRIIRGDLIVRVGGPELDEVVLDADGIETACQTRHWAPPIPFARQCLVDRLPDVATKLLGTKAVPKLSDTAFEEAQLRELRHRFSRGDLVSVRVRIRLERSSDEKCDGHLDVFLRQHADGERRDSYYIREGMTIPKIKSKAGRRGVQALVSVDAGPLSELLGDSEGPSHEDWDKSAERLKPKWKRGCAGRVDFCRRIVDAMVELLNPPKDEPDFDLLSNFFSIEERQGTQIQPELTTNGNEPTRISEIVSGEKWYHVTERRGGFTISPSNEIPVPEKGFLKVSVAYDLPSGDPLKNWSNFDFVFRPKGGSIRLAGNAGVDATIAKGNVVELGIKSPKFRFSATGFDVDRDLYVKVEENQLG